MKIIIAGSRDCTDPRYLDYAIGTTEFLITEVLLGGARGVDQLGLNWARDAGIANTLYKADWNQYKRRAGILRNIEMGNRADGLIAIWDGASRGTEHMIQYMMGLGKPIEVTSFVPTFEEIDHAVQTKR